MRRLFALALLALATATGAQERILEYGSDLTIRPDGSLDVVETIRVRAEGQNIRRGIYRDFPTRYRDRFGNRVVVDFQLIGVDRDGRPEPHFIETLPNGVRINTGNDDFLTVPADITFTLRYRTTRQLGHFEQHDELYWNATGLGWDFPIETAWARVHLPRDVARESLRLDAYTGPAGAQGRDYTSEVVSARDVIFRTTRPLSPREGITVAVGFPKGLVPQPTRAQRMGWFFRDNGGVLFALAGLALLVGFYAWRWHRVGRDPQAGPVFPRYDVPNDLCAGEVRMLSRMGYDNRCFAADVVQMGVRGYLDIHADGDDWRLVRRPGASAAELSASQRTIADKLFAESNEIELKNTEAARVIGARAAQTATLTKRLVPVYFNVNGGTIGLGFLFSLVWMIIAFVIAAGNGIALMVVVVVLMLVAHGTFAHLLKAPTRKGRAAMDGIEGLRRYLSVAERDEIASMPVPGGAAEPALDAKRYETLLPYALALDVEAEWSGRFTRAVGVREAQASSPSWYHGSTGSTPMGMASMGSSLGTALTQHISSSSTPPGSSSGGGGGGSSGGGGGGGGGGGR